MQLKHGQNLRGLHGNVIQVRAKGVAASDGHIDACIVSRIGEARIFVTS